MKLAMTVFVFTGLLVAPAIGVFDETFSYPDGALTAVSAGLWQPQGQPQTDISVVSQELKLSAWNGDPATEHVYAWVQGINQRGDGLEATIQIKKEGSGTSTFWYLYFGDTVSGDLGYWYGTETSAAPRMELQGAGPGQPLTGGWDELKLVVDFTAGTTKFYFNGADTGFTALHSGKAKLDIIEFKRHYRNDLGGQYILFDNIHVEEPPCSPSVTPAGSQNSAAAIGGAAVPPTHTYTVTNNGSTTFDYSVAETDVNGVATDHAWLPSLTVNGDGIVGPGQSETVDAALDPVTAGLAAGLYSGHILFTDTCSPPGTHLRALQLAVGSAPCAMDAFPYPDGNLDGRRNGDLAWTREANSRIFVENEMVKLDFDDALGAYNPADQTGLMGLSCQPCEDGTITVSVKVKALGGNSGGNAWSLWYLDENGNPFGRWYGFPTTAVPRISASLAGVTLTPDAWDDLRVVIDTKNDLTYFYHTPSGGSEVALGSLSHGADGGAAWAVTGNTLGGIAFWDWDIIGNTGALYFDDLMVHGCVGTCFASVAPTGTPLPWAFDGGSAATPASTDYTIANEGAESFTFSVVESDAAGTPTDYGWLTVGTPTGLPLAPGSSEVITASYDTTGLDTGLQLGYLKFTDDTCNPGRSYIRPVKLNIDNCITEGFDYADGRLDLVPAWNAITAHGSPSPIEISGNALRITGGGAGAADVVVRHRNIDNCPTCPANGIHIVKFKIRGHSGSSRFWELHVSDLDGDDQAAWRGSANDTLDIGIRTRTGEEFYLNGVAALTGGWDEIEARINIQDVVLDNINPNSTAFYFNGALVGTLNHEPAGDRVRRFEVVRFGNDTGGDADPVVEIDDLVLTRCREPVFCNSPFADAQGPAGIGLGNGDGDVDQDDFAVLQRCVTIGGGPIPADPAYCRCFDRGIDAPNGDGDIDSFDISAFEFCASGANVAADPTCTGAP